MKKRKFKIYLTPAENSIVIQSLNHLRNTILRENRDTGCQMSRLFFSERVSGFFHAHLSDFPHT